MAAWWAVWDTNCSSCPAHKNCMVLEHGEFSMGHLQTSLGMQQRTPNVHTYMQQTAGCAYSSQCKNKQQSTRKPQLLALMQCTFFFKQSLQQVQSLIFNQTLVIIQCGVLSNSLSEFECYSLGKITYCNTCNLLSFPPHQEYGYSKPSGVPTKLKANVFPLTHWKGSCRTEFFYVKNFLSSDKWINAQLDAQFSAGKTKKKEKRRERICNRFSEC